MSVQRIKLWFSTIAALALTVFHVAPVRATFIFTPIDDPLATAGTVAHGVFGNTVVGYYMNGSGTHGFTYDGATYKTLDNPLATNGTFALGISGNTIVGTYNDASGSHGFLYDGTTWTTLDTPLGAATHANGISGNFVCGYYSGASGMNGFTYDGATWTSLSDPQSNLHSTMAWGTDGTTVVGNYDVLNSSTGIQSHGFRYNGSTFQTLDDPLSAHGTYVRDISEGVIVGLYFGAAFDVHYTHGFFFDGSTWTTLDYPSAVGTEAFGIAGNSIVGEYFDANSMQHGFVVTIPEPAAMPVTIFVACAIWQIRRRKASAIFVRSYRAYGRSGFCPTAELFEGLGSCPTAQSFGGSGSRPTAAGQEPSPPCAQPRLGGSPTLHQNHRSATRE